MMFPRFITSCLLLLLSVHASLAQTEVRRAIPVPQNGETRLEVNDLARFLAGIQPSAGSPLSQFAATPEWSAFASEMNARWSNFDAVRLQPIRNWRTAALSEIHLGTLFYPFSGPDFIYAETLFPRAERYILCGQEPVGELPSIGKNESLSQTLGRVQSSLKTLLEAGYFVTQEMRSDLKTQGTLPLLCIMLARSDDRILSVNRDAGHAEIHFLRAGDGRPGTLDYFCVNLRNEGIGKGGFVNFVKQSRLGAAYIKAASYLLHEPDFSTLRDLLLSSCPVIVQDDSGIPLRYFDPARWNMRLYGTYVPPLDIFKQYYQPGLAELYRKTTTLPLGFGIGYQWNPRDANLVIYSRK